MPTAKTKNKVSTVYVVASYFALIVAFQYYHTQNITKAILANQSEVYNGSHPPPLENFRRTAVKEEPHMRVVVGDLTWFTSESEESVSQHGGRPAKAPVVGWEDEWMIEWKNRNYDPTERLWCKRTSDTPYENDLLCKIPAYIPPRIPRPNAKKIPRVIFISFMTRYLGPGVYSSVKTLLHNNPEYELVFFLDEDIDRFMCDNYPQGNNSITDTLSRLKAGAARADVWRMMIIGRYGGVYLDIDEAALAPLPVDNDVDSVVSGVGGWATEPNEIPGLLEHWALIYEPNHPIISQTIENIQKNTREAKRYEKGGEFWSDSYTYSYTVSTTGPGPYQTAVQDLLKKAGCKQAIDSNGKPTYAETLREPEKYCGENYPEFVKYFGNFKATEDLELGMVIKCKLLYPDEELLIMDRTYDYDSTEYAFSSIPVDPNFCSNEAIEGRTKERNKLWRKSVLRRQDSWEETETAEENANGKDGDDSKEITNDGSGDDAENNEHDNSEGREDNNGKNDGNHSQDGDEKETNNDNDADADADPSTDADAKADASTDADADADASTDADADASTDADADGNADASTDADADAGSNGESETEGNTSKNLRKRF